jgi:Domain of unknown function (DUF4349)
MLTTIKSRIFKVVLFVLLGFLALFFFRFIYGYTTGLNELRDDDGVSGFFSDETNLKRNYASDSYKFKKESGGGAVQALPQEFSVDQKYEKTATVKARSTDFDNDDKILKNEIKKFNVIVQYEQNAGKKGSRSMNLLLGVAPEKFDSLYATLIKIGKVASKDITKVDKTSEFKNLNAKKSSLEITRQSLLEIKKQSGKIDEYINLQNRILEIEQELQGLGVLLGDFSEENEFCTVRFSLMESREIKISLLHRLKVAFEWAVQYYLLFIGIVAFAVMFAFFLLLIIDKILPSIMTKINQ